MANNIVADKDRPLRAVAVLRYKISSAWLILIGAAIGLAAG